MYLGIECRWRWIRLTSQRFAERSTHIAESWFWGNESESFSREPPTSSALSHDSKSNFFFLIHFRRLENRKTLLGEHRKAAASSSTQLQRYSESSWWYKCKSHRLLIFILNQHTLIILRNKKQRQKNFSIFNLNSRSSIIFFYVISYSFYMMLKADSFNSSGNSISDGKTFFSDEILISGFVKR